MDATQAKRPVGRPKGLGKPAGSGRRKGSKNKRTQGVEAGMSVVRGQTAVQFLASVYRSKTKRWSDDQKIEAAKAVAPYQSPKLANVTMRGPNDDGSMTFKLVLEGSDATA